MLTLLAKLAGLGLLGYLSLVLLAFLFQDRLIFHPQPLAPNDRARFSHYAFELEQDGQQLSGWYLRASAAKPRPLLIYYGGNAEEVSWNIPLLQRHLDASVLLLNYRGYGDSSGAPSERALVRDALAAFDQVSQSSPRPSAIFLMGRSLGSGVATAVAAQREVDGLILVTPFDSMAAVGSRHYPLLPVRWLLRHRFDSIALAPGIDRPLLALLAGRDRVIPPTHGKRLVQAWGGDVKVRMFEQAEHRNISDQPGYWESIEAFIQANGTGDGNEVRLPAQGIDRADR